MTLPTYQLRLDDRSSAEPQRWSEARSLSDSNAPGQRVETVDGLGPVRGFLHDGTREGAAVFMVLPPLPAPSLRAYRLGASLPPTRDGELVRRPASFSPRLPAHRTASRRRGRSGRYSYPSNAGASCAWCPMGARVRRTVFDSLDLGEASSIQFATTDESRMRSRVPVARPVPGSFLLPDLDRRAPSLGESRGVRSEHPRGARGTHDAPGRRRSRGRRRLGLLFHAHPDSTQVERWTDADTSFVDHRTKISRRRRRRAVGAPFLSLHAPRFPAGRSTFADLNPGGLRLGRRRADSTRQWLSGTRRGAGPLLVASLPLHGPRGRGGPADLLFLAERR